MAKSNKIARIFILTAISIFVILLLEFIKATFGSVNAYTVGVISIIVLAALLFRK